MMEQQVNYPCETLIAFPQVDRHDQAPGRRSFRMTETELNLVATLGDDRAEQQAEGGVADGGGMAQRKEARRVAKCSRSRSTSVALPTSRVGSRRHERREARHRIV